MAYRPIIQVDTYENDAEKNKISIPRQIGIKPFLLLIVPKNITIKNNNTDYERLLNAIHTQYTVYLLLENAIPLVKMTRTLNRL